MDPQMEKIIGQIANAIAQGANPEEIMQELMNQGASQEEAQQIIEMAIQMAQGGEGSGEERIPMDKGGGDTDGDEMPVQGMGGSGGGAESQQMLEAAISELGPATLLAIIIAYEKLGQGKQAFIKQLTQMAQQDPNLQQVHNDINQEGEGGEEQRTAEANLFGM